MHTCTHLNSHAECFPAVSVTCPRRAWVNVGGSSMYPDCFGGASNCGTAIGNLVDGNPNSNGAAEPQYTSSVMLDVGFERTDVRSVRLSPRADGDLHQSQMLSVYLSRTKPFEKAGSTLCRENITFARLGEAVEVECPKNAPARYVTVIRSNGNMVCYAW